MKRNYMYKMYKSYGQIFNFISYYIIYVGLIFFFLNRFLYSNLPNLGRLQICGPKGNGFFHFISSMVTKLTDDMIAFLLILFFSSHLQPFRTHCKSLGFQSPYPWDKLSYIKERKNKKVS